MATDSYDTLFKVLLIGNDSCAKELVARKLTHQITLERPISTLGFACQHRIVTYEGDKIKLQVWDTADQDRFHSLNSSFIRNVHGVIFVF